MSQHAWFEHFKEKLQGLTPAFEDSGTSLSLLGFALKEKHLSTEEYLKWAMTHYRLPLLQSRFFTETPPSPELFAKWSTHYPWSVECLPVAEWDGSLIVACLQPPQDFPSFPSSIIVLTSIENMEATWKHYHPEVKTASTPATTATSTETPDGIDLSVVVAAKKSSDSFSIEDLGGSSEDASSEEGAGEEKEGRLEGLFDGFTVTKLEALPPKTETISATGSQEKPSHSETVIDKDLSQASVEEIAEDSLVAAAKPAAPIPPPPGAKSSILVATSTKATAPASASIDAAALPAAAAAVIPPPPQAKEIQTPPPFEDSFSNKPIPIAPRPAGIAKPTLNPVANGTFALEKLKKKNTAAVTDRVKKILSEMKVHFEKSMILTLDDQETQAAAFAWDENFKGIKDTAARVPLKTPSIFNIVAATSKPFHGYVSLNEINEKFFEDWNQGRVPDHVTVAPILINDKLVGMLVGFAEKSAYNKSSLNLAEKLTTEFVKGLAA